MKGENQESLQIIFHRQGNQNNENMNEHTLLVCVTEKHYMFRFSSFIACWQCSDFRLFRNLKFLDSQLRMRTNSKAKKAKTEQNNFFVS